MNERTLIFIVIALAAIAGVALSVFHVPDRAPSLSNVAVGDQPTTTTAPRISEPDGGVYESLIVYHCNDGDFEICTIRPDGTGFRQVTNNNTDDVNPAVNKSGQIAYICASGDELMGTNSPEICIINSDGSGRVQVTHGDKLQLVSRFEDILINDRGEIFYICRTNTGIEICRVNTNGSGRIALSTNEYWETNLSHNTIGDLVFLCFPEGTQYTDTIEICSMSEDGAQFVIYHAHENYENGPIINDSGYIVSNCERSIGDPRGLCVIDILYSDRLHLFEVPEARDAGVKSSFVVGQRYAINNPGQIVYQCAFADATQESELCIINVDGTGFRQLTDNFIEDESPAINDMGVVAYICGKQLCVINADGTGQRRLSDQVILAPGAFAKLKMN